MNDKNLRKDLIELLRGGSAHVSIAKALSDINPQLRSFRPEPKVHSIYEELEHMRIAQEDIYRYAIDEDWESPEWPDDFWPDNNNHLNEEIWESTYRCFLKDLEKIIELVKDESIDLTSKIPHGAGHTYLREILLVADHNSYHIGKIIDIRKTLGDW